MRAANLLSKRLLSFSTMSGTEFSLCERLVNYRPVKQLSKSTSKLLGTMWKPRSSRSRILGNSSTKLHDLIWTRPLMESIVNSTHPFKAVPASLSNRCWIGLWGTILRIIGQFFPSSPRPPWMRCGFGCAISMWVQTQNLDVGISKNLGVVVEKKES